MDTEGKLSAYLVIGEITKPQGVKGEIKVRPITCNPMRYDGLQMIFFERGGEYIPKAVRVTRIEEDAVYLMIEGVRDRTEAEQLRGAYLYVDRAHAVRLPKDAEFVCDLIGCDATDDTGRVIGRLTDVMQPGAGDVYVFRGPMGEVLVPALKSVVLEVDVRARKILLSAKRLAEVAVFEND